MREKLRLKKEMRVKLCGNEREADGFVRTYMIHLLETYVNILCNWLIL